jgi:two-component system phosphate regulon sensor histidine kinase PhoR
MSRTWLLFVALLIGWSAGQVFMDGGVWGLLGVLMGAGLWAWWDARALSEVLAWLKEGEGRPPLAFGAWAEVGDRAYRALRQQKRKTRSARRRLDEFLSAIQASPNGVTLLDQGGRLQWCNSAAVEHLGIDAEEDQGQVVRNIVRDPAFSAYMQGGRYDAEVQFSSPRDKSGETLVAVQLFPYGQKRFLLLSRDVTAIRRAERMRRDFVANVSHEIKTPLTVIRGVVETLQDLPLDESQRQHYLGLMEAQATRMNTLVADLLTLSTLEGSPPPPAHEWHDATRLAQQVLNDGEALAAVLHDGAQGLSLSCEPGAQVAGSQRELISALGNLVSNAVRYTPPKGQIQLHWQRLSDGGAAFVVQDNGPGIAAVHLSRLSERFYRVDQSRSRDTGGTGLGLAIVKHIVQRHGGELVIDSELGRGSRFAVHLPPRRVRWPQTP